MEQNNNRFIFTCTYSDCGKKFKMPETAKPGKYNINCPNCKRPLSIVVKPATTEEVLDNSGKPMIAAEGDFVVGTKYAIECPHCHKAKIGYVPQDDKPKGFPCPKCHGKIAVTARDVDPLPGDYIVDHKYTLRCSHCNGVIENYSPSEAGPNIFHCPTCGGRLIVNARNKTNVINISTTINPMRGKLQLMKKWGFSKSFPLPEGSHVIGRYDVDEQSDIAIKDDPYMSRRSIMIDVEGTKSGYTFKLKVLKSGNPVLLNNKVLKPGEIMPLNFGDSIILGKTHLRFVKDI